MLTSNCPWSLSLLSFTVSLQGLHKLTQLGCMNYSSMEVLFLERNWSQVCVWFRLVWYGVLRNGNVWSLGGGSFKVLHSLEWYCMVCMILCGLVQFTMLMYFLVGSKIVFVGYVWSCTALHSYAQFLCLLVIDCLNPPSTARTNNSSTISF